MSVFVDDDVVICRVYSNHKDDVVICRVYSNHKDDVVICRVAIIRMM